MRAALLCVFFTLIVHKEGATAPDDDFRPIPIPLDEWNYEKREGRVGTLHETINTDKSPTVAAVPAHYWEDALRHSVYLTLVRDKIDQLIAKKIIVSPDIKPDKYASKEVDDHDLWEKIKNAPFDRIEADERPSFGDVTIMAKGRLIENKTGLRFTEDERSRAECADDKCMEGVKAFWSVKRVRQRDAEMSPGRYHYELTFSVNSNKPKKQKKPFENPVRTFTVRENPPDVIVGSPQEHHVYQPIRPQIPRPQRAVWFHRNIVPATHFNQPRYYNQGLDRIFSSFFSDDDTHAEPPPRYKPNPYLPPMMHQYSKVGYVGLQSDQHQQKRLMTYVYKPNYYKYPRPPLQAPPLNNGQHYHLETEAVINNPHLYPTPPDHRYLSPSNIVKTTRPAVLPTPPIPNSNTTLRNISVDLHGHKMNISENITKEPEVPMVYKTYSKSRPAPMKVSYFPEHIRPPVYNAPPGVFVTMDKKPFKPMPPLKYVHPTKSLKKPIDFRPSPQVLDVQFSDPDTPPVDSAFRPILINFTESKHNEDSQNNKQTNKNRKQTSKKPPKKHENIKAQRITTTAPDIITIHNSFEDDNDTMQWADVLGAFTKTTPMESHKEKVSAPETTTKPSTNKEIPLEKITTTTERNLVRPIVFATPTPPAPKKRRTRPPHKFDKPDKVKKHKRITTTTTKAPETKKKKTSDLTPQASSAATGPSNSWPNQDKTTSTTPAASVPSTTTTTKEPSTTTAQGPTTVKMLSTSMSTTTEKVDKYEVTVKPTQPRSKNRFRISTLMQKGTSVKHDRWNIMPGSDKKIHVTFNKPPPRRKGSNFQGYASNTEPYRVKQEESHRHISSEYETDTIQKTDVTSTSKAETLPKPTQPTYEETAEHYDTYSEATSAFSRTSNEDSDDNDDDLEIKINNDDIEPEDHSEFIFTMTSTAPNEKTNEIEVEDSLIITEQPIITSSHSAPRNKTRCKKKKNQHLAPTKAQVEDEPKTTTPVTTTAKSSTGIGILDELLGFSYDDAEEKQNPTKSSETLDEEESENHEKYLQLDEDFEDFFDNMGGMHKQHEEKDDVDYEDDEKEPLPDDDVSPFDNGDADEAATNSSDKDYDDYHERSYSLLELMAME